MARLAAIGKSIWAYPFQILDCEAVLGEPNGNIHELRPLEDGTLGPASQINYAEEDSGFPARFFCRSEPTSQSDRER